MNCFALPENSMNLQELPQLSHSHLEGSKILLQEAQKKSHQLQEPYINLCMRSWVRVPLSHLNFSGS